MWKAYKSLALGTQVRNHPGAFSVTPSGVLGLILGMFSLGPACPHPCWCLCLDPGTRGSIPGASSVPGVAAR